MIRMSVAITPHSFLHMGGKSNDGPSRKARDLKTPSARREIQFLLNLSYKKMNVVGAYTHYHFDRRFYILQLWLSNTW